MSPTSDKQSKHTKLVTGGAIAVPFALVAVISAAANLRAGISSLGAVLEQVMASFQASASVAGVLTAMPGFAFAIMGLAAVPIARRFGLSFTLFAGMVAMLVGLAFRPLIGAYVPGGMVTFIVLTALVVGGIALLNVLLPAWIKQHAPRCSVLLMSCYSGFLGLSGAVAPLSALWFSGEDAWRPALGIWALLAATQVVVWILVLTRVGVDKPRKPPVAKPTNSGTERATIPGTTGTAADSAPAVVANKIASTSLWRSPTAVAMMVLFGLQSSNAYVQMGWLPQMYIDQGVSPGRAAVGLAVLGTVNVIGGVSMPFLVARIRDLRPVIVVFWRTDDRWLPRGHVCWCRGAGGVGNRTGPGRYVLPDDPRFACGADAYPGGDRTFVWFRAAVWLFACRSPSAVDRFCVPGHRSLDADIDGDGIDRRGDVCTGVSRG